MFGRCWLWLFFSTDLSQYKVGGVSLLLFLFIRALCLCLCLSISLPLIEIYVLLQFWLVAVVYIFERRVDIFLSPAAASEEFLAEWEWCVLRAAGGPEEHFPKWINILLNGGQSPPLAGRLPAPLLPLCCVRPFVG